ncbi:amylo-alpha-1,6-glucosidase [Persicobacter psychrovividus]
MIKSLRYEAIPFAWNKHWAGDYYEIAIYKNGTPLKYEIDYQPWALNLLTDAGKVSVSYIDDFTMYLGTDAALEIRLIPLQPYLWINPLEEGKHLELSPNPGRMFHAIKTDSNTKYEVAYDGPKRNADVTIKYLSFIAEHGGVGFGFRENKYQTKWEEKIPDRKKVIADNKALIMDWMSKMPQVREDLIPATKTAWYLLYAFQVAPAGHYTHRTILCSKNSWLTKTYGWDNCFHALAVASADLDLAYGQLHVFFDNQLPNGSIPDSVSDLNVNNYCIKPPIQGWTIKLFLEKFGWDANAEHLKKLYEPLGRLTDFWFNFRDDNKNGRCQYQHGNDSGWDNSTAFIDATPLEAADLSAYLVQQLEILELIANKLGRPQDAVQWKAKKEKQLDLLLTTFVKDDHFVNFHAKTGQVKETQSLLNYIPLILGKKIPKKIRKALIKDLQPGGDYLSDYGLASESVNSPYYEVDGYWRGPIWAPPNYQIFTGLIDAKEFELAKEIAERYCRCYKENPVFNENNNALTGEGLQAPGVSWTAAVFILMATYLGQQSS